MDYSPRKSTETCNTQFQEFESPLLQDSDSSQKFSEKYSILKQKYSRLYKEHNILLKTLDLGTEISASSEKIQSLNHKISDQQREIMNLRQQIDSLNNKVEKGRVKRRNLSLSVCQEPQDCCEQVLSLEISADVCLIKFLIHRLVLGQKFRKDELLKYREALNRIEEKFARLAEKKKDEIVRFMFRD
jgi:predicted  nucleic acid-binding Zn-ribbon protein